MNVEDFREYFLAKKGCTESFPFDKTTLVFKVADKIFALGGIENFSSINLKCDPEKAIELREGHAAIKPGFHMNKKHWNTVEVHELLNDNLAYSLIDHSYNLVVSSLPKKIRELI